MVEAESPPSAKGPDDAGGKKWSCAGGYDVTGASDRARWSQGDGEAVGEGMGLSKRLCEWGKVKACCAGF